MIKKVFFILLFSWIFIAVHSQDRLLTVEDATNQNPKLNAPNLNQLQWIPGSDDFLYLINNAIVQFTANSLSSMAGDTILRLSGLNHLLKSINQDTLKKFPAIRFLDTDRYYFIMNSALFEGNVALNNLTRMNSWDKSAENTDIDPSRFQVAFTRKNNLYITNNGVETEITKEKNPGILFGSERVHRNEFGIGKGTFWSPQGNFLAFYRMDETMVTEYPLVDISSRPAQMTPTKYPMAGMTSHEVTVGVFNPVTGKTVYLPTDSAGVFDFQSSLIDFPVNKHPESYVEYLTNITWSPDEKHLYIACLNRDQDHMWLNKYDAVTGRFIKTLFEERSPAYVEPQQGPHFLNDDPEKFIWESRRDGYNHLYLYSSDGELIRQLTHGAWEVIDFQKPDKTNSRAFFLCNKDHPIESRLWAVDLKTGSMSELTSLPGTHTAQVSDDGAYVLDAYTNRNIARQIGLLHGNGNLVGVLLPNENPLKDYNLGKTSIFTILNESGDDLFCRMIKPVNFDSTKKYPVIIYVYGGPHSQLVTESWLGGGGLFLNYLADLGYLVFTLDNRGTSNRGSAFEQAIFRNLGKKEVNDQMAGVGYLKSLPYVDSTRIGINGWSYGGFLTLSMFLQHPGDFKVAVCGGPVVDWKYYEVMYGERYMDTPELNPEGYQQACLLNYIKNLQGKLLIIHDYQDGTVVPQNSLVFLKQCVDEGKPVDYFIYPGHEHNVRGKDRVHLNQKMVQYFQDYL